jgi:hypothetical protein
MVLALTGPLVLVQAMTQPLSHDEHQFLASGYLLGAQGLLPYRDFPFHHLPNLSLLYALLGRLSPALLLNARLLSAAFGLATAGLVFALARRWLRVLGGWPSWAVAAGAALALVLSPLFEYTSGRAWNHALPTCLAVAAMWVQLQARHSDRRANWVISGGLLGIAAGARASFLAAVLPFGLFAIWPRVGGGPRRLRDFLAGIGLGLAPTAVLAALAPRGFLYGNLIYPLQNAQYRRLLLHDDAMNLPAKLVYFVEQVLLDPVHLLLAATGLWLAWRVRLSPSRAHRRRSPEVVLALGTSTALGLAALVPTPSWYQYFYAPLPFGLLALAGMVRLVAPKPGRLLAATGLLVAALAALRAPSLRNLPVLARPGDWLPVQIHDLGVRVAEQVGDGLVLSLAPLVPLEGDLQIYPAFATGSLTWRVSPFMSASPRRQYGVISPQDLQAYLGPNPPGAVLVGFELHNEGFSLDDPGGLELPLEQYAQQHGYRLTTVECVVCARRTLSIWLQVPGAEPSR